MTPEVADGPHSAILEQVTNGLAVRMAVLYLLSGSRRDDGMNRLRIANGRIIDPSQGIDRVERPLDSRAIASSASARGRESRPSASSTRPARSSAPA